MTAINKAERNAAWPPTREELAKLLRELLEHCYDSIPFFPSDEDREGEEDITKRCEAALAHFPGES